MDAEPVEEFCSQKLKALADPDRLRLVQALYAGEMAVSDLAELLEMPIVKASHHLGVLRQGGIVEARREGRFHYYRLTEEFTPGGRRKAAEFNFGCCRLELPPSDP